MRDGRKGTPSGVVVKYNLTPDLVQASKCKVDDSDGGITDI
jgi:hypothetical protein